MNSSQEAQIRLILEHQSVNLGRIAGKHLTDMIAKSAQQKTLRSGHTIKAVIALLDDIARQYIAEAVEKVAAVVQDIEAFDKIVGHFTSFLTGLEANLERPIQLAIGAHGETAVSIRQAASALFAEMQDNAFRELEIHKFSFQNPAVKAVPAPLPATKNPAKNPGGKPLAAHWDAMWAEIAVQLHEGDLKPETQADIERTMADYLDSMDISASESTVRWRARRLWSRMTQPET